jgi:hypothetical protein
MVYVREREDFDGEARHRAKDTQQRNSGSKRQNLRAFSTSAHYTQAEN